MFRVFSVLVGFVVCGALSADDIDFQRDIRPILSDRCFHCHGPDEKTREADLRLDNREDAVAAIGQDAESSELLRRLCSDDPDEVMPPPESGKSLSKNEIALIRKWIDQGAEWPEHWSFSPPRKAALPEKVRDDPWIREPIDAFVLARLDRVGVQPSADASRRVLIRRLSFDLTGLPPAWEDVQAFEQGAFSYEELVDRLLASEHFGERMAMDWMDVARYADTDGYQADSTRTNWPWRDWVVNAFNDNKPFDEFTIEQFAGDLLPDASADQIIATCFHRNHMTNGEGGRDPEESRIDYVIDRVNTIGAAWLGLTLACTQCHSHKYDPITQREYYQLNAFFNSIDEDGRAGGGAKPFYQYQSEQTKQAVLSGIQDSEAWLQHRKEQLQQLENEILRDFDSWLTEKSVRIESMRAQGTEFSSWHTPNVVSMRSKNGTKLGLDGAQHFDASGPNPRHEDYVFELRPEHRRVAGMRLTIFPSKENGKLALGNDGHFILTNMKLSVRRRGSKLVNEIEVATARADYEKEKTGRSYGPVATVLDDDPRSGWTSMGADPTEQRTAVFGFSEPVELDDDEYITVEFRHRSLQGHANLRRFRIEFTDERGPATQTVGRTPLEKLAQAVNFQALQKETQQALREQFLIENRQVQRARADVAKAEDRLKRYRESLKPIRVMVLKERDDPRPTHILRRGVWDQKGDVVTRGAPAFLPPLTCRSELPSRLDLAQWIVSKQNPLTARVYVNRIWQMLFGAGLVRTPEDFGRQGESPTHPQVLDWLAVEFMDTEWNVKHLIKRIVLSSTYRQASDYTEFLLENDPENRWLARNGRFRLPSWIIRDSALAVSGRLSKRMGGPPVFPFQPAGAWADATMGRFHYQTSVGSDRYRRSLYTFWRRSVAPTGLFDVSKRRVCEVRIVRTNTPLHALVTLNDETFVESARSLARRALNESDDIVAQIQHIAKSVLSRSLDSEELATLLKQHQMVMNEFSQHVDDAQRFLKVGQVLRRGEDDDPIVLAALGTIAHTILNLDEAMTRE